MPAARWALWEARTSGPRQEAERMGGAVRPPPFSGRGLAEEGAEPSARQSGPGLRRLLLSGGFTPRPLPCVFLGCLPAGTALGAWAAN